MESETEKNQAICGNITPWYLIIRRVGNGYILCGNDDQEWVLEDDEHDELKSHETMLWMVIEHFGFYGTKHDPERLRIIRQRNKNFRNP